jgi:hypothetical protein
MENCRIEILPLESMVDQPLEKAVLSELPPRREVIVRACVTDEDSREWASWGTYQSDAEGRVALSLQKPSSGTIPCADPSALLWSMRPKGRADALV